MTSRPKLPWQKYLSTLRLTFFFPSPCALQFCKSFGYLLARPHFSSAVLRTRLWTATHWGMSRRLGDQANRLEWFAANPSSFLGSFRTKIPPPSAHIHQMSPNSVRPMPKRKIPKNEMVIRNKWPTGKSLRCRLSEMLKLGGASTNKQTLVVMPTT